MLLETLKAFQQQIYSNWECIIIDDDLETELNLRLRGFLNSDNRFSYYKRPFNYKKGPASCRNFGLENAKGEFIQFFDDDDIPCPEMLRIKVEILLKNEIDVGVCPLQFFNPETNQFEPELATHWKIGTDSMTFFFRIDPRAKWADGRDVTSEDIIATYKIVTDKGHGDPNTYTFWEEEYETPKAVSKYIISINVYPIPQKISFSS